MGIIKAIAGAAGGGLADQWLETVEPDTINNSVLASYGVLVRKNDKRSVNKKRTEDVISNGSIIHVPENVYMLLVSGGKIIAGTDDPGYYRVDKSEAPSIFFRSEEGAETQAISNTGTGSIQRPGGLKHSLKDSWERLKFGGTTPLKQQVVYVNKQEFPNIRFGTRTPVSYTDRVLVPGRVVPCKVTSFGTYSIRVMDPLLFYAEVCQKTDKSNLSSGDMAEQYINEFLMAYTTALASLSADQVLVSDIPMKTMELGMYMAKVLDESWLSQRGFIIQSVGIAGISFDDATNQLLERYASDSILLDPNARAARMTAGLATGLEAAGSNEGGAMMGFAGMAMGMNAAGGMGMMPGQQAPATPHQSPQPTPASTPGTATSSNWICQCGTQMPEEARFCSKCGNQKPVPQAAGAGSWVCACGHQNAGGHFCSSCGKKKPEADTWQCSCGHTNTGLFCSQCGTKRPDDKAASAACTNCGWKAEPGASTPAFCPECGTAFPKQP
ncbi:SPFH domain-containing protein [Anoxynatronum sibiricum]|uniref:SPFH domain-containing protein n=1 Tax=Anoxynatronum sibiricum TaxID=210623 RepID=A0ABU9VR40_9CLOT